MKPKAQHADYPTMAVYAQLQAKPGRWESYCKLSEVCSEGELAETIRGDVEVWCTDLNVPVVAANFIDYCLGGVDWSFLAREVIRRGRS